MSEKIKVFKKQKGSVNPKVPHSQTKVNTAKNLEDLKCPFEFKVPGIPGEVPKNAIPTGKQLPRTPLKTVFTVKESPIRQEVCYVPSQTYQQINQGQKNVIPKGKEIPRTPMPIYKCTREKVAQASIQVPNLGFGNSNETGETKLLNIEENIVAGKITLRKRPVHKCGSVLFKENTPQTLSQDPNLGVKPIGNHIDIDDNEIKINKTVMERNAALRYPTKVKKEKKAKGGFLKKEDNEPVNKVSRNLQNNSSELLPQARKKRGNKNTEILLNDEKSNSENNGNSSAVLSKGKKNSPIKIECMKSLKYLEEKVETKCSLSEQPKETASSQKTSLKKFNEKVEIRRNPRRRVREGITYQLSP